MYYNGRGVPQDYKEAATLIREMSRANWLWGAPRIRDRPTASRSPWQNAYAERLIGSVRREFIDHVIVFGESHLRRVVSLYASYYNEARTHLSLGKDAPIGRPIEQFGRIIAEPILGGLHHRYARI